jgi:hypothetical protein
VGVRAATHGFAGPSLEQEIARFDSDPRLPFTLEMRTLKPRALHHTIAHGVRASSSC